LKEIIYNIDNFNQAPIVRRAIKFENYVKLWYN